LQNLRDALMIDGAPEIFVALEQSGFSASIRQSPWLYPAANVGHIIFLVLFVGGLAVMDLRLIGGLAATEPAPMLRRARRLAIAAFAGMALTGFILFAAEAGHLARNPVFRLKLVLIGAGLVNIGIYELWARRAVELLPAGAPMPAATRNTSLRLSFGSRSPLAGVASHIFECETGKLRYDWGRRYVRSWPEPTRKEPILVLMFWTAPGPGEESP
jgi:hypothetical protein